MKNLRRGGVAATALAVGLTTAIAGAPAANAKSTVTDYGFSGRAYGTTVKTGQLGLESGRTAQAYLGCTRRTGQRTKNALAEVDAQDAATVEGVKNWTRSYQTKKRYGTRSRSRVAKLVLGASDGPSITIEGLRTTSNAFVKRGSGKLRARSRSVATDISGNTGTPLDDVLNDVDAGLKDLFKEIRKNGGRLEIPGLGVLEIGGTRNVVKNRRAVSQASALRADLFGADGTKNTSDDVKLIVAKSRATIKRGVISGVMRGKAIPARATALGDLVKVGRIIDKPLPCEGTRGKVQSEALADADLFQAGALELGALKGSAWGVQDQDGSAKAWTRSKIADVNLGDGAIKIDGIVGKAKVKMGNGGKIRKRTIKGSRIGSLTIDGETRAIPDPGQTIEVPGVAKLRFFVKNRNKRGIEVIALRVELLDGTGAVVNLGEARTYIKRS